MNKKLRVGDVFVFTATTERFSNKPIKDTTGKYRKSPVLLHTVKGQTPRTINLISAEVAEDYDIPVPCKEPMLFKATYMGIGYSQTTPGNEEKLFSIQPLHMDELEVILEPRQDIDEEIDRHIDNQGGEI